MPRINSRTVWGIWRGLHAFLSLDAGLVSGEAPDPERHVRDVQAKLQERDRQLREMRKRLEAGVQQPRSARQPPPNGGRKNAGSSARPSAASQKDLEWHRRKVGGRWDELGKLQFDFLREQGLEPRHHFLDVGCGSLRGGIRFLPYLEAAHYYGVDRDQRLLDAGRRELENAGLLDRQPILAQMDDFGFGRLEQTFDYALAQSVFTHLPLNLIARCLMNMDRVLRPGGTFFATYFENRSGHRYLDSLEQGDGIVTYYDKDPFHYTLDAFEWACGGTSLSVERVGDWNHPRNQLMLAFRRAA